MSTSTKFESPRRRLSDQQAETVAKLTAAALEVLRDKGHSGLTVREVAKTARVAPATAYTYFSSKEHLVVEVFWRRLSELPESEEESGSAADRTVLVLRQVALLVADEPELASATTASLLGPDAEVDHLRTQVGIEIRRRLLRALDGAEQDMRTVETLEMIYSGALLRAGMGYSTYEEMADSIEFAARKILE